MALMSSPSGDASAQVKTNAERLGYPRDTKLLIIHGDDLAVAHSVNAATFAALDRNAISSASVMVPCPWFTEVAAYGREHPNADLGIHLTLTSEWKTYRWGPVAGRDQVPSLLDPDGYLWAESGQVGSHAKPEEVEREVRAQIQRALSAGIKFTHIDSHMVSLLQTPALVAVYRKVAREYHVPFLAARSTNAPHLMLSLVGDQDIVLDSVVTADEEVRPGEWKEYYVGILRGLKPGLTELIVHLGFNDAELKAITCGHLGWDAAWRQRDYDVVTNPEFKLLLDESHTRLVTWRELGKLLPNY